MGGHRADCAAIGAVVMRGVAGEFSVFGAFGAW
jgi:hypothetical protein